MSESSTEPGTQSGTEGRVVVGVDGSPGSLAALDFAFAEAQRRGTGLLVVAAFELPEMWVSYGLPVSGSPDEMRRDMLQHTRRVVTEALGDRMTAEGAPQVEVVARGGGAAQVLVNAAAGNQLLVVGSRGLGGFRRMLLGSVSMQCVQHAPCPVTVVRSTDGRERAEAPEAAAASEATGAATATGAPAAVL